jgi:hypothetical protein
MTEEIQYIKRNNKYKKTQEVLVRLLFFKKQTISLTERKKERKKEVSRPLAPDLYPGPTAYEVDKVALGQVSSEYFGFPCQFAFHRLLHNYHHHHHLGLVQ